MKKVFRFNCDCGRQGELSGVFISTQEKVDFLIESKIEVYFGEVLGKHSEVYGRIEAKEITLISDNPEVVKVIEDNKLENGHNPFDYMAINIDDKYEDMYVSEIIEDMLRNK